MIDFTLDKECLSPLAKGEYYIYDNNKNNIPSFVMSSEKWSLKIINDSFEEILFYQNDNCLMKQNELKKCDWLAIHQNAFYFIEVKDAKTNQRRKQRIDARKKFDSTVPHYLEKHQSLNKMELRIVLNFRVEHKLTRASHKYYRAYYKESYNAKYLENQLYKF